MSYYGVPMDYYKMPVRWAADEKEAPVPGWGMWLSDVGYKEGRVGVGQDPGAPAPTQAAAVGVSASLGLVLGGVLAGTLFGYLLAKGH